MDLHSGSPYWLLLHGLKTVVPPLTRDRTCDVAIIGSGITGALLAHRLAADGVSVTLIDRRDLAQGSTAASTALLQYDLDVPLHKLRSRIDPGLADHAFALGVRAITSLEETAKSVSVPLERVPSFHFTADQRSLDDLAAEHDARRSAGLDVRWVEREELWSRHGLVAAGAIESAASAQVDPYELTHALLADAIHRRAHVHDRTRMTGLTTSASTVVIATDRGPSITASFVVYATGYESAGSLPPGLVSLRSTYALATEPIESSAAQARFTMWEYADPYLYARWAGDRLLIGGEDEDFTTPAARDRLIGLKARSLTDRFRTLMPGLSIEPAFAWTGTFGTTPDGLGYIGAVPGRPRELYALGFGGNGITCSALAADLLADRIAGRENKDSALFCFERTLNRKAHTAENPSDRDSS